MFNHRRRRSKEPAATTGGWAAELAKLIELDRVAYQNLLHLGQARHEWLKKLLTSIRNQAGAASVAEEEMLAGV